MLDFRGTALRLPHISSLISLLRFCLRYSGKIEERIHSIPKSPVSCQNSQDENNNKNNNKSTDLLAGIQLIVKLAVSSEQDTVNFAMDFMHSSI